MSLATSIDLLRTYLFISKKVLQKKKCLRADFVNMMMQNLFLCSKRKTTSGKLIITYRV